jgi:hypothetical protein
LASTDIDPERLTSITAWTIHSGATNIRPPLAYNPVEEAWPGAPMDAVYLSNLIHLISTEAARTLLSHLAGALAHGGLIAIYGPFKRGTDYASDGDKRFDAAIRAERPDAGYKDIGWVETELSGHRLIKHDTLAMPANNLMTLWTRARMIRTALICLPRLSASLRSCANAGRHLTAWRY